MSLINEALKRTRDAAEQPGAAREPQSIESYRFSAAPDKTVSQLRTVLWVAGIALLLVVGGFGIYVMKFLAAPPSSELVAEIGHPAPPPPKPEEIPADILAKTQPPMAPPNPASALALPPAAHSAPVAAVAPEPAPVPAVIPAPVPTAPEVPKLVLQGITSNGKTREALINGLELNVGDEVEGATILAIEARVVKLKFGGKEISLRMP